MTDKKEFAKTKILLLTLTITMALTLLIASPPVAATATTGDYLIRYEEGAKSTVIQELAARGGTVRFEFDNINVLAVTATATAADELALATGVVSIAADPQYRLFDTGTQTTPYGIDMVQARDTWDANRDGVLDPGAPTGSGIRVCIVDTGIFAVHEDLGGGGVNIVAGQSWVGEDWSRDRHGHGTHVAGTVTAMNNDRGVVGVSPGTVELLIADVFNDLGESQDSSVILDAVNWCADQGANVISMSLGGPIGLLGDAYQAIYDRGILVVAAAGNDSGPVNNYPASYDPVVSVAAVDSSGTRADFSNFVPQVEVAAPGVSVLSAWPFADSVAVSGGPEYTANPVAEADPAGVTSGPLADGGDCNLAPAPGAYDGQIVLCERGGLPFRAKIDNAAAGGAVAAILYNDVPGNFSGTYGVCCSSIPAVSLSQADGQDAVANWLGTEATITIHGEGIAGYAELSGTSMATPHASATAAVLWSACPNLTNDQIRSHLDRFTMEPAADLLAGRDVFYGYGIVQLKDGVDALRDGIDEYDSANPNGDGSNAANVECADESSEGMGSATGGGWMARSDGGKINFGFDVESSADGLNGDFRMRDKAADVKIELTTLTSMGEAGHGCGPIAAGAEALRFEGDGTYNGATASFRICVEDNGSPGKGLDRFYLSCTAGCSYDSDVLTPDAVIDAGNIQVAHTFGDGPSGIDSSEAAATTLILDPLLLSESLFGALETFTVTVYDQQQNVLPNAAITLTRVAADGTIEHFTAVSDLTGMALFTVTSLNQPAEYTATSGTVGSNAIALDPTLP